jgi:uncharacterized protein YbaA (DUF1428 family)
MSVYVDGFVVPVPDKLADYRRLARKFGVVDPHGAPRCMGVPPTT